MPGLHLLHACLPLAGSHSFWETAVYFSHPSPPCALELHGLTGTRRAATGEQNFFPALLSMPWPPWCGHSGEHGPVALLGAPQAHCEELVAPHKLQSDSVEQRRVLAAGVRGAPVCCRLQEGSFGRAAFWNSVLLSFLMPLKLPAGIVPSVPSLQSDGFGAFH